MRIADFGLRIKEIRKLVFQSAIPNPQSAILAEVSLYEAQ
jgi:hypothetical protein